MPLNSTGGAQSIILVKQCTRVRVEAGESEGSTEKSEIGKLELCHSNFKKLGALIVSNMRSVNNES